MTFLSLFQGRVSFKHASIKNVSKQTTGLNPKVTFIKFTQLLMGVRRQTSLDFARHAKRSDFFHDVSDRVNGKQFFKRSKYCNVAYVLLDLAALLHTNTKDFTLQRLAFSVLLAFSDLLKASDRLHSL